MYCPSSLPPARGRPLTGRGYMRTAPSGSRPNHPRKNNSSDNITF